MEAHSLGTPLMEQPMQPRAKDGGIAAGFATIIRELGALLTSSGGLVVVVIGVFATVTITTAALASVPDQERATVATAAFTVLGTIVGAYFGVRVGARGKDEAEAARDKADAKVENLLAHVEPPQAHGVLNALRDS
jgi:hypothetical protein